MGMITAGNELEKSQLATKICDISTRAIACANFHHPRRTKRSTFIDWYQVLGVNENADIYGIRKQYHKLGNESNDIGKDMRFLEDKTLQLHPDKNKHSKAETAFKLVSEAYYCLSDRAKRSAFDSERHTFISCTKCNNTTFPYTNTNPPKIQKPHQETSRFERAQKRTKELRAKLKEEANIIEKCLMTASRRELVRNANANGTKTEMPVFNPSDYYQQKGSPQNRTIFNHKQMEDLRAGFRMGNRCINDRTTMNSSPVFQYRSERASFSSTRDR